GTRGAGAAARPTRVRRETTTPPSVAAPEPAAQPAAEQTRVMPAVERTAALPAAEPAAETAAGRTEGMPAGEQTSVLPPADGAEAERAADQAAAQGDSTQVLPTVSTDEEGSE
ncbi:4Fe-4S ferredoxin, partial [Terrabacter sp. RAF57]